ncbi:MAG: calcium/sodium antiporter [Acidobacteriota bacterium]
MIDLIWIIGGAALLYFGGDLLVNGSSSLARILGMSPLVVGLTVVAFGTSSPELAATLVAAYKGAPQVAIGNVLGSNIANLGLILGSAALFYPLLAMARFIRRELPFMILTSALMMPLALDGSYGAIDGLMLVALLVFYLWMLLRKGEKPVVEEEFRNEFGDETGTIWKAAISVLVGIGLLVGGAYALVEGAVSLARGFGISETVIGITAVALGTSLPELAAALVAARRREGDIILGNIVGSNIFNVLAILGLAAIALPIPVDIGEIRTPFLVMMFLSLILLPFLLTRRRLSRPEGAFLLLVYLGYTLSLYLV